nr:AAA family ATPase [Allorhizocola rhizosphaerae]
MERVVEVLGRRAARLGRTKLVLIDGPSGAGKTVFAGRLAPAVGAEVVHTDDLLDGWGDQFTYWDRLERLVLQPIRSGSEARYQKYDWVEKEFAEWVTVEAGDVLIVEGVGAARARGRVMASVTVFVDAPEAVRLARSMARDGLAMQEELSEWRRREALHFAADGTAWCADVVIGSSS